MAGLCRGGGIAVGLLLFGMAPAYAYLDPGSVSLAVQALVASVAGAIADGEVLVLAVEGFSGVREEEACGRRR